MNVTQNELDRADRTRSCSRCNTETPDGKAHRCRKAPPAPRVKFARFDTEAMAVVDRIVVRWLARVQETPAFAPFDGYDAQCVVMDLGAVHAHTPLRLQDLADADDFNFGHDMSGIANLIDRRTGKLTRSFVPRFARRDLDNGAGRG